MYDLMNITTETMSHIQIAEVVGSRPDNVKWTMDTLVEQRVINVTQSEEHTLQRSL